ncbi:MAG: hypothetical protein JW913_05455 [Chitinispirillaceae bacterium]|nr:hypothetical protein [Chitinispirillaceae bacterium]
MVKRSFIPGIWLVVFYLHAVNAQWVQTGGPYGGDILFLAVSGGNYSAACIMTAACSSA